MRKLLFIDHAYHRKTRSSDFFLELLAAHVEVERVYVDLDATPIEALVEDLAARVEPGSLVYVWQFDFLVPIFLSLGARVICSPMYDGSSAMPQEHWRQMRGAGFVNFSLHLHEAIRRAGAASLYVKYYPEPRPPVTIGKGGLRGFFWRRRPEHGLDLDLVDRVFGGLLESLHVHDAPDLPDLAPPLPRPEAPGYEITTSTWFERRADMAAVLEGCDLYIAPRLSEGIGMGFLEAMAAGMVVAAHDAPTHNEYIVSGFNGILFNRASTASGALPDPAALGRRARLGVQRGRVNWEAAGEEILAFLSEMAARPATPAPFTLKEARDLAASYLEGLSAYRQALSALEIRQRTSGAAAARPRVRLLLGSGFHRVEEASERFFPVRFSWTAEQAFTVVPLEVSGDLELIFREGSGRDIPDPSSRFTAWRQGRQIPLRAEPLPRKAYFRLVLPPEDLRARDSIEIRTDWPLPPAQAGQRRRGLVLLEAGGIEFMCP